MRRPFIACSLLFPLALAGGGCAYRGAIYASYQEAGLAVRTTADGNAPVKVNVGYDRAVAAFVPRRGGDAAVEEATALISKDEVRIIADPTGVGTDTLLAVDSAFITGTAAIVASAPAGALVRVHDAGTPAAIAAAASASAADWRPSGSAGERIATALTGFDVPYAATARPQRDRLAAWLAADAAHVAELGAWLGADAPSPGIWIEHAEPAQLDLVIERFAVPPLPTPPQP